jgi:Ca2+-transporting ATPase
MALEINGRAIYSDTYQQQHPVSPGSTRTSISSIRPSSPTDMASTLSPDRLRVRSDTRTSAQSLDGETLRPRADSTISSADTAVRSRANSEATNAPTKMEYDDVSVADALNPDPRNEQDFIVQTISSPSLQDN